jgi:hypothetical protein
MTINFLYILRENNKTTHAFNNGAIELPIRKKAIGFYFKID